MRGDSLRDFYAKTLAVLGLGLLAAAGAAVDHWPGGAVVPAVASARLPMAEVPALAQNFDQQIPAPSVRRAPYARGTIHAKNVGSARFLPAVVEPTTTVSHAPVAAVVPVPQLSIDVVEGFSVASLPMFPVEDTWAMTAAAPVSSSTQAPGFIGGALRKTKDSIVRTGAVTGATITGAFKGVVGAFKKVSPF